MKRTLFLILLIQSLVCSAQTDALKKTFSYGCNVKYVTTVLHEITKLTQVNFTYNNSIFSNKHIVTIPYKQYTIESILQIICGSTHTYKSIGGQILISIKPGATNQPTIPKPSQKNTKIIYDTIRVYDTTHFIVYDTVRVTIKEIPKQTQPITKPIPTPQVKPKNNILVSTTIGSSYTFDAYSLITNADLANKRKESTTPYFSYNTNLSALYNTGSLLTGIGIQLSNNQHKSSFSQSYFIDDPTIIYTDTLWFWKYTKLFTYYKFISNNDSVAITVYDSTYTYTLKNNPKKIEVTNNTNSLLTLKSIQIPLYIGYTFTSSKKWSFSPYATIAAHCIIHKSGIIPLPNGTTISIKDIPYKPFSVSYSFGLLSSFSLADRYKIVIQPFAQITPSMLKSNYNYQLTNINIGCNVGFIYTIPYDLF